jgi:hypothetical protein
LSTVSQTFSTFSSVQPLQGWPERSQFSSEVSPCLNWENHSKVCILPYGFVTKSCLEHFIRSWCSCSFPKLEAKLIANALLVLISH